MFPEVFGGRVQQGFVFLAFVFKDYLVPIKPNPEQSSQHRYRVKLIPDIRLTPSKLLLSSILFRVFTNRISQHSRGKEGICFRKTQDLISAVAKNVVLSSSSGRDLLHALRQLAAKNCMKQLDER